MPPSDQDLDAFMEESSGSWTAYRHMILNELKGLRKEQVDLRKEMRGMADEVRGTVLRLEVNLAKLNVKASIWGAVAGVVAVGVAVLVRFL